MFLEHNSSEEVEPVIEFTSGSTAQTTETINPKRFDGLDHLVPTNPDLHLRLYSDADIPAAMQYWAEVQRTVSSVPVACSVEWVQTWLEQYHAEIRPWFAVAFQGDSPVGICLLTETKSKMFGFWSYRQLHFGTAGEPHGHSVCVEYNDLLVREDLRAEFLRLLRDLCQREQGWDQLVIPGVSVDENNEWSSLANISGTERPTTIRVRECRYFDLKACREQNAEVLSQLGKSTRSNLKRRVKRLEPVEVDWAESVEEALTIFDELVELHQARWQAVGQPGAFASKTFHQFQRTLIERLHPHRGVALVRVRSGEQTLGCLYLLNDRNRLLDYISGLAPFENAGSPGLVAHYLCMCEALKRGFDAYDFLVGEKRHKENLGKSSQDLQWIVNERPRVKFAVRDLGRSLKQAVRKLKNWRKS